MRAAILTAQKPSEIDLEALQRSEAEGKLTWPSWSLNARAFSSTLILLLSLAMAVAIAAGSARSRQTLNWSASCFGTLVHRATK